MQQADFGVRGSGRLRRRDIPPSGGGRRSSSAGSVLLAALDHGPVARSTIARLTGLSPSAVSRQCSELLDIGLLRENIEEAAPKGVGRPHIPVDVHDDGPVVCGLHIGVPHVTLALVDLRGRVIARERLPHPRRPDPDWVLSRAAERIPAFLTEWLAGRTVWGLGVASGGWVDPVTGAIVDHPPLGWQGVPVRDRIADATGLPVQVDSHCRALARAEQLFGDDRARSSIVHLFVGSVVDAAFGSAAVIHHGPRSAAGAVAHLPLAERTDPCECGRRGCLQAAVSEQALTRRAREERVIDKHSFAELVAAARAGNARAVALFRERARLVGAAAALLLDVLNPEVLVVVEAGVMAVPECLDVLRSEVRSRSALPRDPREAVVASSFPGTVPAVAAGTVMLDRVYRNPLECPPAALPDHRGPHAGRN
jgi:predicted NBD/HSP70 family sugar kinase